MTYPNGFLYRKPILAGSARPASDLSSFSKLFVIAADSDIAARTSSQKFQFTEADGTTTAPYGGMYFDSSGNLKARAKFATWPTSATAGVTVLGYLYYGDAGTDQSNKAGAIDSNVKAYLPCEETPTGSANDFGDWSGNHHGTSNGSMGAASAGQVGNGATLDGSNDYISIADHADFTLSSAYTLSCIAKPTGTSGRQILINQWGDVGAGNAAWLFEFNGDKVRFGNYDGSAATMIQEDTGSVSVAAFRHYAVTWDGSTGRIYVDGVETKNGSMTTVPQNSAYEVRLGRESFLASYLAGILDEAKIVNGIARSADWIAYDYTDQFSNSSTFSLGAEETESAGTFTASPSTIPKNHSANITITLTGSGTTWDGTTIFTLSGVAGVTKVSQSVASATSATIVITTGSTTGTLTITESVTGTATATVTVATASISPSATNLLNTTPTVTITGTNNIWLTSPPVFTFSAGTFGSLSVSDNNTCTVQLTSGAGTAQTVTDTTTGASNTLAVSAATLYYATGPTRGAVNVARTYTLYANGTTTATITGHTTGTGTFASTVALNGTTPVTLSYTPTDYTDSPHTLSFTDSASLTDPGNISLTVTQFADTGGGMGGRNGHTKLRP